MKVKLVNNFLFQLRAALILTAFFAVNYFAGAQSIWNGTNSLSSDTNWSSSVNWLPNGVPGASSNVVFNDRGAAAVLGTIDNVVDSSLAILQMAYRQTNGAHNTLILPGVTLTISNAVAATNLLAGTENTNSIYSALMVTNIISGAGGTLAITSTNLGSSINVRQITTSSASSHLSVLDMSGLDNFNATIGNFYVGVFAGTGTTRPQGMLFLARTNIVSVLAVGTKLAPSIDVGDTGSSPDVGNTLALGITNNIAADTIVIGNQRSGGVLKFNPAFTNITTPSLYLRGHSSERVTTLNIGDNSSSTANIGSVSLGVVDFSGGTVDAMVGSMTLGDGQSIAGTNTSGTATGRLTMTAGTLDVNTLEVGFQNNTGVIPANTGTVNINGGTLTVNTSLRLAKYGGSGGLSIGTLNVTNGTVQANSIVAGGGTSTINMSGTLIVTNSAGTTAAPLTTLSLSDGTTLQLAVNGGANVTNIVATGITTSGNSGTITLKIGSLTNVVINVTYPLISYTGTDPYNSFSSPPVLPPGYTGSLADNSGVVGLTLTGVPAPAPQPAHITSISVSGMTLNISATNGAFGGQYVLLGTTNVATPANQWTRILTNNFDGSGNLNLSTNIINPAVPQQFYLLLSQ